MPTTRLIDALLPHGRTAVLLALADAGNEGIHLREVARRAGLNSKTVMRELHALREAGILVSREVGRQVIYRLNPDCPIYEDVRSILRKTVGISGVLRSALAPLMEQIEQAYVYGSHAHGEDRPDSDIDLMVVGTVTLRELSSPLREAGRTLHRVVSPTLYTPEAYARELEAGDSFVARVHIGKRLNLIGGER
ncbi:nucleotidyltransferase domain-containing protein [Candidatus Bipolaricaulota bacterium]|nr:nucleotidyltransferase domain-containing protein [Candidatus Bipolaricaulota bacterium]